MLKENTYKKIEYRKKRIKELLSEINNLTSNV
jgi:hypothetical protein